MGVECERYEVKEKARRKEKKRREKMDLVDRSKLKDTWSKQLDGAIKCDLWGQVVEAVEGYELLVNSICTHGPSLQLNEDDDEVLHKLIRVLKTRTEGLSIASSEEVKEEVDETREEFVVPTANEMKVMTKVLDGIFNDGSSSPIAQFPFDVTKLANARERFWSSPRESMLDQPTKPGGVLIPRPVAKAGEKYISIDIMGIGIKDAEQFVNPIIRVTVLDAKGNPLEPKQETPIAEKQARYRVTFNTIVHIQTSMQKLTEDNAGIFLEFVHYKENKRKTSTKCWCLLEPDELTEGEKILEIYKKPIEKNRTNFKLFTKKKLYMNIKLIHSSKF